MKRLDATHFIEVINNGDWVYFDKIRPIKDLDHSTEWTADAGQATVAIFKIKIKYP